jgi:cell filamentation protein
VTGLAPWQTGDEFARWDGYLQDDGRTLRNLVGARSVGELRYIEDALVEARALTMREHGLPASYDLDGLRSIHRHLFQDVYAWAGEPRTVEIRKGDVFFAPVARIESSIREVADYVTATDNLRAVAPADIAHALADVYAVVNHVHPFREGNGRTQREYLTALARESGHHIDWPAVSGAENDYASQAARSGDRQPMHEMFARVVRHSGAPAVDQDAAEALRLANLSRSPASLQSSSMVHALPARPASQRSAGREY